MLILLGAGTVSLGRPDLCKVLYPFVSVLKRQISITAFFCGSRIPFLMHQVVLAVYHYRALGDSGLETNEDYKCIHFKTQKSLFPLLLF